MTRLLIPVKITESINDDSILNFEELFMEQRFGRTPFYLLADLDSDEWALLENTNHHFGGVDTPESIATQYNVDVVLASYMGYGPYTGFQNEKIVVLEVKTNDSIKIIIENFENGLYDEMKAPKEGTCCSGHHN